MLINRMNAGLIPHYTASEGNQEAKGGVHANFSQLSVRKTEKPDAADPALHAAAQDGADKVTVSDEARALQKEASEKKATNLLSGITDLYYDDQIDVNDVDKLEEQLKDLEKLLREAQQDLASLNRQNGGQAAPQQQPEHTQTEGTQADTPAQDDKSAEIQAAEQQVMQYQMLISQIQMQLMMATQRKK